MTRRARLPARHIAWSVAKLLLASWMIVYAIITPPETTAALGASVAVWVSFSVAGIITSIVGMVLALRYRRFLLGRMLELSGLIIAAVGPLIHASTMVWIMVDAYTAGDPTWNGRVGPMFQSIVIAAFLMVRFVEVRSRVEIAL